MEMKLNDAHAEISDARVEINVVSKKLGIATDEYVPPLK